MTPEEIVERLKQMNSLCRYVSITGGEPLIHDLADLVEELVDSGYEVWGETSGTKVLPAWVQARMRWVVSPKYGYLPEVVKAADHVKLLVGADMHLGYLLEIAQLATGPVFLQPVESPSLVQSRVNLRMAIDLAYMHPAFRLSVQMHKHLNLP
jgi:organic radical activating enzyme